MLCNPSEKQLQAIGIEEKLDVKAKLKKANELLTYAVTLGWIIVEYLQFVIDSTDRIKESVRCIDNIKCQQSETESVCSASLSQSYQNELDQKLWICISYIFIALEINNYIV